MSAVENLLCAVLREAPLPVPGQVASDQAFLARGDFHGVQALLYERLAESEWPPELRQSLRGTVIEQAKWELRHRQILNTTLAALAEIAIEPVLFKGTALAYSLYSAPVLRARSDTDLIIAPADVERADTVLTGLGFTRAMAVSGEFVSYQASYIREQDGDSHALDLHWRINNSEVLAQLFTYDELRAQARSLPKLGPHALAASPVHALLLACMHRSTHKQNPYYVDGVAHFGGDRLIWLYDIHLLAGSFTDGQWNEFVRLSELKGLRAVCLEGFEHARACFHTEFPEAVVTALSDSGPAEPAALYLGGSRARQQWMDFRAIAGGGNKLRFLRESVFPSETYMRHKYPEARPDWLPWLYLRRAFGGVAKKLRSI